MYRLTRNLRLAGLRSLAVGLWLSAGIASAHGPVHEQLARIADRLAENPAQAELHLQRASLLLDHGDFELARGAVDQAMALEPRLRLQCGLLRLQIELNAGATERVIDLAASYLREFPESGDGWLALARASSRLGRDRGQAVHAYDRAITLIAHARPQHFVERYRAVIANEALDYENALRGLDEGVRRLGPIVSLQLPAIELEVARGDFEAALRRLATLQAQSRRQEIWLVQRAEILVAAGQTDAARHELHTAREALASVPASRRETPWFVALAERVSTLEQKIEDSLEEPSPATAPDRKDSTP